MASPMELGAINECKPLTPEVKEFRKVNNLCMYCGGKIHIALNCPNKKTEKQRSHHVASLASIYVAGRRGTTPSRGTKRPLSSEVHSYPIGRVHYAATSVHKNLLVFPATIFLQRKIH
ncbi:hypothetical protein MUCCIDRAFT_85022 [Mucor lusitanicus CBS 277.49]|uniref:CCHC-type zinc finger transcription factor n=1 Tax=Mucor lusitanicus CBS 277.49 TaxID=747725 RepID=A0A168J7F3_MUCCL|nr:hypothetical protein MUCCIDRAFT_85022 [Mucor lusitanicus CBS 277.49]